MSQLPPSSLPPGSLPQPPLPPNQPQQNSNRTLWIVLGAIGGGSALLLICGCIAMFLILNMLGSQVSTVFDQVDDGLQSGSSFEMPSSDPVDVSQAATLGSTIPAGYIDLTINSVRPINGDDFNEPAPGNTFVAVELEIANRSEEDVTPEEALLWTRIQDGSQQTYDCCAYGLMLDDLSKPIKPGATGTATAVYEIAEDADPIYWVYEEFPGEEPVVVLLR